MTIQYYVGGKIVGLSSDTKPTSVPANTTFIESDTFTEFIFVAGVWELVGGPTGFDDTDLKVYWKWDEVGSPVLNNSQSAVDLGSPADIQVSSATFGQTGVIDDAVLFNGTTNFGVVGTSTSQFNYMHNTTAKWTLAMWLKVPADPVALSVIMSTGRISGGLVGTDILMDLTNNFDMSLVIASTTGTPIAASTTANFIPDTTNFHFYVYTYDQSLASNNFKITRDNSNLEQFTKSANAPSNNDATNAMQIARIGDNTQFGNFVIDETSNWNKIMSGEDQTALYNGGAGLPIY